MFYVFGSIWIMLVFVSTILLNVAKLQLDYGSIVYGSAKKSNPSMLDTVHHQ